MDNNEFRSLPPEYKYNLIKPHLDNIVDCVKRRMGILSELAVLSAAMLVLATFNDNVIPLSNRIRLLICFLLFLMIASLWFYIWDLSRGEKRATEIVSEYLRIDLKKEVLKNAKWKDKLLGYAPYVILLFFSIIIVVTIITIFLNLDDNLGKTEEILRSCDSDIMCCLETEQF